MKHIFLLVTLFASGQVTAQNVLMNNSFETYTSCPTGTSQLTVATGWFNSNYSPDYYNSCATIGSQVSVPSNIFGWGYQYPSSGSAYTAILCYGSFANTYSVNLREYMTGTLSSPLTPGLLYHVQFKVVLYNSSSHAVDHIGAKFTSYIPVNMAISNSAHVYSNTVISDTLNWQLIDEYFIADSAYTYIVLGNHFDDATTNVQVVQPVIHGWNASCLIDDVSVSIANTAFANTCLGDSTTFQNNASPGTIATSWNFGDTLSGSNNVAFTTNASHQFSGPGTYIVTTVNFQPSGINDTLQTTVTIYSTPVVNLGNDTTLCPGQTLTLMTDSGYTSYQWSNGNTTNSILIANPGTYSVIVSNNGCTAMDSILISNTICAPTISLASSDTLFCEKQCIDFFDFTTNNPISWQWTFQGASPDTSTAQNPTGICYNNYGSFAVTLVACNAFGCDSVTYTNFINEYQNPVDSIYSSNDTLWSLPFPSYQWYEVTSGIIAGATNQYYVPTQLGSYFCVVVDSIGCIATSNTTALTAVQSVISNPQFAIFPNPNDGNFEIVINEELKNVNFDCRLFNSLGQVAFKDEMKSIIYKKKIELNLPDGLYILKLTVDDKTYLQKIIVKK